MKLALLTPCLATIAALAIAPSARADGRTPGSLLIFPEFNNRLGDVSIFTITNTNTDRGYDPSTDLLNGTVRVHFIYVGRVGSNGNPINCLEVDRDVTLSPGDTFSFLTSVHNPQQQQGFMYCYAVSPVSGLPIDFDHLIGATIFIDGKNGIDYSTEPVSLLAVGPSSNTDLDNDGNRDLDGNEYEPLPDEILIPRFLATGGALRSELVLLGLSGGASFQTIADLLVYNDNEEVFSAQYEFKCWDRQPLDVISPVFTNTFLQTTNHASDEPLGATARESGWIHVDGGLAYSSIEQILDPAVYAVLVERVSRGAGASDLPFERGEQTNGDLWPNGPWGDGVVGDNQ